MSTPAPSEIGLAAGSAAALERGSTNGTMHTPVPVTGTTVFLREEGSGTFVPVHHQSSMTLRDLAEEFNVSSVFECDAGGNVQPRAVAFDSPSDVLHSGRHYIARRDARAETGGSYVTFRGKILVKEYELEHPTPPASRASRSATAAGGVHRAAEGASQEQEVGPAPVTTPFPDKQRLRSAVVRSEEGCAATELASCTPAPRYTDGGEEGSSISRALALSSERKRPREDVSWGAELGPASAQSAAGPRTAPVTRDGRGAVFQDRTNAGYGEAPGHGGKAAEAPQVVTGAATVASAEEPPPPPRVLRFIPFAVSGPAGAESYVTLEDLQMLCKDVSTQEGECQRRHKAATDILESARRVLFTAGESV
ncbi:hypothetical protein NESM_000518400 [Novymonas esmeraldas]|uniref:Uncharacterized protein n=1 Tax=Novymonas esmeraldas TaxID=1808958 RepID=A0AAW0ERU5_9TRYP